MKSLIDEVLSFSIKERNNLPLVVGDCFLSSFVDIDHGPFLITKLSSDYITFTDLATGIVICHEMSSFGKLLEKQIYKIDFK
jgi:hypothetical protein